MTLDPKYMQRCSADGCEVHTDELDMVHVGKGSYLCRGCFEKTQPIPSEPETSVEAVTDPTGVLDPLADFPEPLHVVGRKQCSQCDAVKPWSEFHADNGASDGLRGECKLCRREANAVRREAARARCLALGLPTSETPEAQTAKRYYAKNRAKISERMKAKRAARRRLLS